MHQPAVVVVAPLTVVVVAPFTVVVVTPPASTAPNGGTLAADFGSGITAPGAAMAMVIAI